MFPNKYRWPSFLLHASACEDYAAIIDEECKVRACTPNVSKFRDIEPEFSDDVREEIFCAQVSKDGRSRGGNVAAFFTATFEAWKNYNGSGKERAYVGYSPVLVVDAAAVLEDLPAAHFLHIVRNPWSAYAHTKKRPVPLSLRHYMTGRALNQCHALLVREQFPDRMHILRIEDVISQPVGTLDAICEALAVSVPETLGWPIWNGQHLDEVYPWGTIRVPTREASVATARELSPDERAAIKRRAGPCLDLLSYAEMT